MRIFENWLSERDQEVKKKLEAVRRWLWSKEHNHKNAPAPISQGDDDYEWIMRKANKLGPLDPNRFQEIWVKGG
jgi:hypothetical protein